ncbi:MAG: hypothetical protein ACRD1K_19345 [Acidimicrobiales bacterium]
MREPRRDHYIAPGAGDDSRLVMDAAVESLRVARNLGRGDAPVMLHLLASLVIEAEARLPGAVVAARHQGCSWAEVADLLGVTRASAWQRYAAQATTEPNGG